MAYVIITLLAAALVLAVAAMSNYYFATAGLIYYLLTKYNDDIGEEQVRQLSDEARKALRRIRREG